jgi:hypothetical protein
VWKVEITNWKSPAKLEARCELKRLWIPVQYRTLHVNSHHSRVFKFNKVIFTQQSRPSVMQCLLLLSSVGVDTWELNLAEHGEYSATKLDSTKLGQWNTLNAPASAFKSHSANLRTRVLLGLCDHNACQSMALTACAAAW